jgi:hypothetical protein
MARLERSVVTLRIWGDDLVPEEITKLLGVPATDGQRKGDRLVGKNTGLVRIAKTGMWRLCAADREPEDIDGQIGEILSKATPDLGVWKEIGKKYGVDLFCGLFMGCSNEELTISPASLAALGERGIELGLDIYAGSDDARTRLVTLIKRILLSLSGFRFRRRPVSSRRRRRPPR